MEEMSYESYKKYQMADYAKQLSYYVSFYSNCLDGCGLDSEQAKDLSKKLEQLYLYLSH